MFHLWGICDSLIFLCYCTQPLYHITLVNSHQNGLLSRTDGRYRIELISPGVAVHPQDRGSPYSLIYSYMPALYWPLLEEDTLLKPALTGG